LEDLAIEDVFFVFYGYFTAIWYIVWPFGIFYGHLVYLSPLHYEQSGTSGYVILNVDPRGSLKPHVRLCQWLVQGCQIFLGTKYQNGKKYSQLPQTIPNVNKI
jgi:hypothetical protein